ncbi:MAG: DMT family transporter [Phyllobacterium sp.]
MPVRPDVGEKIIRVEAEEANPMFGIGLKVTSVIAFVAMSTLLKASEGIPAGEMVFFRSFFGIFPVLIFLAFTRQLAGSFRTKEPFSHFWRGFVGVCAMGLGFYGLTKLPLPESIAINYASPLLTVMLSAIFLHETVRLYRWSAVLIGLVGVLIILWPRLTVFTAPGGQGTDAAIGAVATLVAAMCSAVAMLLVRKMVHRERPTTIVIYFCITSCVIALATIPFGWVVPTPQQAVLLVMAGLAGGVGQILMTTSYRHAEMSTIAPFEYTSMLLGLTIGYVVFGDVPTMQMIIGSAIVIGAGIFIIYREHRLGLERRRAKKASSHQA